MLPTPAHERDVAFLEPRQVRAVVEVVDHLVAPCEHGRGVDRRDVEAGHALHLVGELDRAQQRLRRHARVVGAIAADERFLDDRHGQAVLAQPACHHLAGRAGADHHYVEFAHAQPVVGSGPIVTSRQSPRGGTPGP